MRLRSETTVPLPGPLLSVTLSTQARMMARPRPDSGSCAMASSSRPRLARENRLRAACRAGGAASRATADCPWCAASRAGRRRKRTCRADSWTGRRRTASLPGSKPRPLSSTSTRQPLRLMLATTS